jgi:hypothetical protein
MTQHMDALRHPRISCSGDNPQQRPRESRGLVGTWNPHLRDALRVCVWFQMSLRSCRIAICQIVIDLVWPSDTHPFMRMIGCNFIKQSLPVRLSILDTSRRKHGMKICPCACSADAGGSLTLHLRCRRDLISKLLTSDLSRRLGNLKDGSKDIRNHPWFKGLISCTCLIKRLLFINFRGGYRIRLGSASEPHDACSAVDQRARRGRC